VYFEDQTLSPTVGFLVIILFGSFMLLHSTGHITIIGRYWLQ